MPIRSRNPACWISEREVKVFAKLSSESVSLIQGRLCLPHRILRTPLADMGKGAGAAFRAAGGTDITAKKDKAVAEIAALFWGDNLFQGQLNLVGILAFSQAQTAADADAVGVGDDGGLVENIA